MNILFTICGRAGSKGFKNKNLKEMNGAPLVYYTLAAIKLYVDIHPDDKVIVVVNTDSLALIELVKKQDVLPIVFVERKDNLVGDLVAKIDVIKDTYIELSDKCFDVVIDLDITSPIRTVEDIENILYEYNKGLYDIVFSVVEARRSPYFNMVENKPDGFYRKICESNYTARQQAPKLYELNASIYAYKPDFLLRDIDKTILEYNCGISVMKDYLVLDIDSEEDFEMMQFLHMNFCKNYIELNSIYKIAKGMCEVVDK